ncbi:MAG: integrase [Eubacteriales bacterium]|nr:integrase [Eubacteriales bacterium]
MFNIDIIQDALKKAVQKGDLSDKTARDYINCLIHLNERLHTRASPKELEAAICDLCKYSVQGHKYISAVRRYEKEVFGSEDLLLFGEPLSRLYNRYGKHKLGKELAHSEETYFRKLNRLNNERLKLAFRLEYRSGLRISEIAALDKDNDILFDPAGKITLIVRKGKGGKRRKVDVINDPYLYLNLKAHIDGLGEGEAPFYSESYLKKKANEHGIRTHDLRRINSRDRFRNELREGSGKRAARRAVGRQLGHETPVVTSLYLGCEWSGNRGE